VNSLDIIRVIVSPRSTHASRADVVRGNVTIVREFDPADTAFTNLGNDLHIEQLSHLSIGAKFAKPSRMKRIFNSADAELSYWLGFGT
jgi:hypothetical protein